MATFEKDGQMTYVDDAGNEHLLFPKTNICRVIGLEEALESKAPAGYGLGGNSVYIPDGDTLKGYNANGWYYWGSGNTDVDKPFDAGSMHVIRRNLNYWTQIALHDAAFIPTIRIRKIVDGNAQPWDWANPPMVPNTEYRTTERCEGMVVYAKRIGYTINAPIGNTTGLTDTTIPHGISGFNALVRCSGKKGAYLLPIIDSNGGTVSISQVSVSAIVLRNFKTTSSAGTFYFDLYYTKTS